MMTRRLRLSPASGAAAASLHFGLTALGPVSSAASVVMQIAAGMGWSLNILCWMSVFTSYRPRYALLMITVSYAIDVAIQPIVDLFPSVGETALFAVYAVSIALLFVCLRWNGFVAKEMKEPIRPKTTMAEAFSRTRRAIAGTFVISATCGFIIESDASVAGLEYAQTGTTAMICLGTAAFMTAVLLVFKVKKANIDYMTPIATLGIATVLMLRMVGGGDGYFSGCMMTSILISFYVLLWLMFISEAYERTLPAFFLLGLALAVARLSVCLGRVCANVLEGGMGLENIPIATWAIWALAAATSVIFICYLMYSSKLSNRLFDVSVAERSQDDALPEASPPTESSIDRVVKKYGLSEREAQIIRDYSVGRTVRYIADWNMLSEHTVKTHLRRAYTKMNIHSRQELLDKIDEVECDILQGR